MKVASEPPVADTVTFVVPSLPDCFWMIRGAVVSDGATSHCEVGSARLTTQLSEPVESAQPEVRLLTSWKRTLVLRRTASVRARFSPCSRLSAAVRIFVFWINVCHAGKPRAMMIATIAMPMASSMSVTPRWRISTNRPSL